MASYRLSLLAEEDARRIYSFGIERFGLRKADSYFEGLFAQFDDIADAPLMYPAVDEIRTGYRRCLYGTHTIYYRLQGDVVQIMRILGRENPDIVA